VLISCRRIRKSFAGKVILDDIDIDICRGDKIGLVGRNGAGKTTLAKIITGNIDYDKGSIITTRQEINIGYLPQSIAEPELYISELGLDTNISGEFQRLTSHLGIKRVNEWSGERYKNLSGGEKSKLALAAVWAMQPDLVIMDEPTNHMDYQGVEYLIEEIRRFLGAAIIISHDRFFLDQTVSQIAEIENGKLRLYTGNYTSYRETKQKEREKKWHTYQSQQKEQKKIDATINKLKGWSEKAHRESRKKGQGIGGKEYYRKKAKKRDQAIKSQIKRLEKMRQEGVDRPGEDPCLKLNFNAFVSGSHRLLEASDISKAYGKLSLFENTSFYINRGEKVGILGPNGCGKTTLLKAFLGQEDLDQGNLFVSPSARIAYVSQELPQVEKKSLTDLIKNWPIVKKKAIFQLLVGLGISYDLLQVVMGNLSRGEQMKIAIGLALMGEYDLLVFDEPTNHLDIFSREALEESLVKFSATVILVSHDRYLLDQVCDHMLVFEDKKIRRIPGSVSEYISKKQNMIKKKAYKECIKANNDEEIILLDTKIARILSELSQIKPGESRYLELDKEYEKLIKQKQCLKKQSAKS
jgi:macrolide transport system ATP-binding/permease protein